MTILDRLSQIAELSTLACSWDTIYSQSYSHNKMEAAKKVFQTVQRIVAFIEEIQNHSELTEENKSFLRSETHLMVLFSEKYSWVANLSNSMEN